MIIARSPCLSMAECEFNLNAFRYICQECGHRYYVKDDTFHVCSHVLKKLTDHYDNMIVDGCTSLELADGWTRTYHVAVWKPNYSKFPSIFLGKKDTNQDGNT